MSTAKKVTKPAAAIRPTAKFDVHFTIEVEVSELDAKRLAGGLDEGSELLVEEAVTAVVDEAIARCRDEGTVCGVHIEDAEGFDVRYVEPGEGVRP
jgi:hypothetical protein